MSEFACRVYRDPVEKVYGREYSSAEYLSSSEVEDFRYTMRKFQEELTLPSRTCSHPAFQTTSLVLLEKAGSSRRLTSVRAKGAPGNDRNIRYMCPSIFLHSRIPILHIPKLGRVSVPPPRARGTDTEMSVTVNVQTPGSVDTTRAYWAT